MIFIEKPDINLLYKYTEVVAKLDKKDVEQIVTILTHLKAGVEYDITFRERTKRSLNANNYHWALVEKIAKVNGMSKYEAHNHLMKDYGTDWIDAEGKQIYVLMKDNDSYLRSETQHYRPTDAVEDRKGTMYRWFVLLLPSHLMNKPQMASLIDGTVAEAKELGIETRTPDEIAQLKAMWGE
jgi:hypothetical protein